MVSLRHRCTLAFLLAALACESGAGFAVGLPAQKQLPAPTMQKSTLFGKPRQSGRPSLPILRQAPAAASAVLPADDDSMKQLSDRKVLLPSSLLANRRLLKKIVGTALLSILIGTQRRLISAVSAGALESYKSSLVTYPLRTKVLTGASLAVIGDYLAQMKDADKSYDVPRAASFAAFDSCYRLFQHHAIPFIVSLGQGNVFRSLFSVLPFLTLGPESLAFFSAMERTFLYQFGLIPFFYYPVFFTFTGFMQGLTLRETVDRAKSTFFPCWKKNLMFWIPIQMVMFGLVDEKWQIPFVCVMGIIWSLILSVTAGQAKQKE
ncbi:hypothetical protein ACHAXT_002749 [Thalassiosira profunda]